MDIAIIGIGLYPFGRHEGVSAMRDGRCRGPQTRRSRTRASRWEARSSSRARAALEVTPARQHHQVPRAHRNPVQHSIFNGCATGGSLLLNDLEHDPRRRGRSSASRSGFDKHPRGAFSVGDDLAGLGLGQWYGETGLALNPQYFAMKTRRYMYDHGITEDCLHRVAVKAFRERVAQPEARLAPQGARLRRHRGRRRMVCDPLRKYHFCSPSEGAAAVVAVPGGRRAAVTRAQPIYLKADVFKHAARYGSFETHLVLRMPTVEGAPSPTRAGLAKRPIEHGGGRTRGRRRRPGARHGGGSRDHAHGRVRLLQGRRAGGPGFARAPPEIDGRLPINTDGGLLANGEPDRRVRAAAGP